KPDRVGGPAAREKAVHRHFVCGPQEHMHRDIAVRDLRTGAVVAAIVAVRGEHFAVAIERDLQNHFLLARLIGGYEIFIAIFDPLQRPAKAERGEDDRDLFLPWMVIEAETS